MQRIDSDQSPVWVRAKRLAIPLTRSLSVLPSDDATKQAARLRERQFDGAPVLSAQTPVGMFFACDVKEGATPQIVAQVMRPLTARQIVSSETPLSALLIRMADEPFLFVLDDCSITGFVTPADLGTVDVRTHFYLQLARLESTLGTCLRVRFPDQADAVGLLPTSWRESQAGIASDLRGRDKFIDEIACLSLDDLVSIAGKDRNFREATRQSGIGWRKAIKGLAEFRNDIMHPSRPFASAAASWPAKLAEWEICLEALIRAAHSLTSTSEPG